MFSRLTDRLLFVVMYLSLLVSPCLVSGLVSGAEANQDKVRVVMLGDSGHHRPLDMFRSIRGPLEKVGISIEYRDDVAATLNKDFLKSYDALMVFANIDSISPEQEAAVLEYVAEGGGYVPVHCASFCFLNSPKMIALTGGQFKEHGGERFYTDVVEPNHEVMRGFDGFESWDETYVHHKHNTQDRTVLEVRRRGMLADGTTEEPWTWVRTEGKGRVFYTAWGHNEATWNHPGFINLLERGVRWSAKKSLESVAPYQDPNVFRAPEMTAVQLDGSSFESVDVGSKIPHYIPGAQFGTQAAPMTMMQIPLPAEESVKTYSVPKDFALELWATENDADVKQGERSKFAGLVGKPMAMNWDHLGRLWLCETIDYPNELQPIGKGRDTIRICEDTDGDGVADKFTLFATGLSIPTAIVCYRDGVIVQDGTQTVYLKDTDGDGVADFRQVLITGWEMGDTHGGVSNFQYGLDNWIWGMQGYNNSAPVINGQVQQRFRQGFWRFAVDSGASDDTAPAYRMEQGKNTSERSSAFDDHTIRVTKLEFVRSTNNNTWGIGFSEDGLVFGSTANGNPSGFMPIANRFYERVQGWSPTVLRTIADSNLFNAITDKVRQVDNFGGYTAAAGHALYTARNYPKHWWNRVAFVCEPTAHLVGAFVLKESGAGYTSSNLFNLAASLDEWAAPTMAEVGPDGNVWVLDWYNFIVQHNPTPHGFSTGKGNAYESDLRDKKYSRIYRVVYQGNEGVDKAVLEQAEALVHGGLNPDDEKQLVDALRHPNFLWRRTAQRLLVEKGSLKAETLDRLRALLTGSEASLAAGSGLALDASLPAIHALWVLNGRDESLPNSLSQVQSSTSVRRNALQAIEPSKQSFESIVAQSLLSDPDPQLRIEALLHISEGSELASQPFEKLDALLANPTLVSNIGTTAESGTSRRGRPDNWLLDAWTSAASVRWREVMPRLLAEEAEQSIDALQRISVVAEHAARTKMSADEFGLLAHEIRNPEVANAILTGLAKGWPRDYQIDAPESLGKAIVSTWITGNTSVSVKSQVVMLASSAGLKGINDAVDGLVQALTDEFLDESKSVRDRVTAAEQAVLLHPDDASLVTLLLGQLSPQSSPDFYQGVLKGLTSSRVDQVGRKLMEKSKQLPPEVGRNALRLLMSRPQSTVELLDLIDEGLLTWNDFELDQKQALREHPDRSIRERAIALLASKGLAMSPDRQKVVEEWMETAKVSGDVVRGRELYVKHCALCHVHGELGVEIGPNLTGMSVHPKEELLIHILDPGRSVEGNFRTYTIRTVDDEIVTGMLASETRTALELINAQAKREVVLREDIDQLIASQKSLMPEGFENQMTKPEMQDLLEFLTAKGKYVPLSLETVATSITTKGMFFREDSFGERMVLREWGTKMVGEVPFQLIDPEGGKRPNVILLHSNNGTIAPRMPKSVEVPCSTTASAIHLLSGVGGWGYPASAAGTVAMKVRITYEDGEVEDHDLINGEHFSDYIRRIDVPKSEFALEFLGGQQMRYLKIQPKKKQALRKLEFVSEPGGTAPIVMGVTIQTTE